MAGIKAGKRDEEKKAVQLGSVIPGDFVRLYTSTFESAITDDSEESFFLKLDKVNDKNGNIALVPVSGKGPILYRSPDFPVFSHEAEVTVFNE